MRAAMRQERKGTEVATRGKRSPMCAKTRMVHSSSMISKNICARWGISEDE